MHRSSLFAVALTAAFVAVAATAPVPERRASDTADADRPAEVARLRAHFDSVDAELRARELSSLSAVQLASRARLVALLREYRDAGRFPHNHDFATPTPYFRDHRGVLCAMAYLIDRSGRGDLVDDVARTRNNAYIGELTDDPRLVAWLDSAGLTVAEAARIQPQYDFPPPPSGHIEDRDRITRGYALSAASLMAGSLGLGAVNLIAPTKPRGAIGIVVGAATATLGIVRADRGPNHRRLAAGMAGLGGFSMAAGINALRSRAKPDATGGVVTLSPAVLATGDGRARAGVLVRARF